MNVLAADLSGAEELVWLYVGILFSVLVPVARQVLSPTDPDLVARRRATRIPPAITPYLKIAVATAILAVPLSIMSTFGTVALAFAAGYGFDSTFQKVLKP